MVITVHNKSLHSFNSPLRLPRCCQRETSQPQFQRRICRAMTPEYASMILSFQTAIFTNKNLLKRQYNKFTLLNQPYNGGNLKQNAMNQSENTLAGESQ